MNEEIKLYKIDYCVVKSRLKQNAFDINREYVYADQTGNETEEQIKKNALKEILRYRGEDPSITEIKKVILMEPGKVDKELNDLLCTLSSK